MRKGGDREGVTRGSLVKHENESTKFFFENLGQRDILYLTNKKINISTLNGRFLMTG